MTMKLNFDFAVQEVADMFVAVAKDRETGDPQKVFRLNETGATIIEALQEGSDEEAIVARLTREFNVDEATARKETAGFIQMLTDNGLASL